MPGTSHYDDYFRSNLPVEQRRAVLEVLAEELDPETTMGEVIDAAEDIGWGDALGELNLAQLAEVLLAGEVEQEAEDEAPVIVAAQEVEADEADEADEDEAEEPVAKWRGKKVTAKSKKTTKKKVGKKTTKKKVAKKVAKKAAKKTAKKKAAAKKVGKKTTKKVGKKTAKKKAAAKKVGKKTTKKATAKKVGKKTAKKKAAAKKVGKKTTAKKTTAKKKTAAKKTTAKKKTAKKSASTDGEEEALSLDQAAKLLVPIVRRLKEATMQELEERTGMGRRKLRFHIGQLVKNGHLTRHGMGRGTCYTAGRR